MYKPLGMTAMPPEMREDRGEIEAALKKKLPRLVELGDIKGDLYMHSNWSDGASEIEDMVAAAKTRGMEYVVLTDHSQSLKIANGLSPARLARQIEKVKELNAKLKGITVLTGSEVDILEDGSLDFADDILKRLDFVVASVHSRFKDTKAQMTRRIVRAMRNKHVRLIGHPTGRRMGIRPPYDVDMAELFKAARDTNTAMEINGSAERMDLNAAHAREAREKGVHLTVDSDSHRPDEFKNLEYGVATARRAWCAKEDILNCFPLEEFRKKIVK